MGNKAEIIKKDILLIINKERENPNKEKDTLILEVKKYNECRYYRGTHSVKTDRWTYRCKQDDFYSTAGYTLIIDKSKTKQAIESMKFQILNKYNQDILESKKSIIRNKKNIKMKQVKIKQLKGIIDAIEI